MSDHHKHLDRELNLRAIVLFAVVLTVVTAAVAALMWVMSAELKDYLAAQDPPRAALPEAREQPLPPGPLLQSTPEEDLVELRATEDELLSTYGWVDETAGIARIPIDRAIELLSEEASQ